MRALTAVRSVVGATLLWGSAAGGGYAIAWTMRSHHAASGVIADGAARLAASKAFDAGTSCRAGAPSTGQLAALLEIPKLALRAPVEQGETETVLSAAVGHDAASAWPGEDGTAVLAAHDVSWFARIGSLGRGAVLRYVSACRTITFEVTGHRIVPSGAPVANTPAPSLVLDTCWPNDALWWTPDRELVTAREVSSTATTGRALQGARGARATQPLRTTPIAVPAPPDLVAQGLTLDTNPTLLGTMQVTGRPAAAFVQSPEPLDVEQAALTAYYATIHAVSSDRRDWFSAVAPRVAFPSLLAGSSVAQYLTRLAVDVEASGTRAQGAVLSASVDLKSAAGAVSTVTLVVNCAVRDGELLVTGWHTTPAA